MDAAEIGTQGGQFLGNLFNPLLGNTTTQTVTEKPSASSSMQTTVIVIVVVVIAAVVGFMVFKSKK
jgi:hypothetical protein